MVKINKMIKINLSKIINSHVDVQQHNQSYVNIDNVTIRKNFPCITIGPGKFLQ